MQPMECAFALLQIFTALLVCAVTSVIAVKLYKKEREDEKIRHEESKEEQKKERDQYFWTFFTPQYLDASFTIYEKSSDDNPYHIISHNVELKEGRNTIDNMYGKPGSDQWRAKGYEEFSKRCIINAPPTYENKLVHRLCVVLNRVGQAAFDGKLQMANVFSIASKMILEDWEKSKPLIIQERGTDAAKRFDNRIFFEWIACASCIYRISNISNMRWKDVELCIKQYAFSNAEFADYISNYQLMIDKLRNITEVLIKQNKQLESEQTTSYIQELCADFEIQMRQMSTND